MIHLTIQQLSSFLDGDITEANADLAREHFAACESCKSKLDRLGNLDAALAVALSCEPDPAFFERFPVGLGERIAAEEGKERARKTEAAASTPAARPSPQAAATRAAHAFGEDANRATPRDRVERESPPRWGREERPRRTARRAPSPAVVSLVIVAIAGTVGALIFGKELASYVLYTPGRSAGVHAAATPEANSGFTSRMGPSAGALPHSPASPGGGEPDAPAPENGEGAWQAESESGDLEPVGEPPSTTEFQSATASYDDAAAELELALPRLEGDEYKAGRFRLAETRFYAWRLDPGKERAVKAAGAIRAFLVGSTPGEEREKATRWLSELVSAGY